MPFFIGMFIIILVLGGVNIKKLIRAFFFIIICAFLSSTFCIPTHAQEDTYLNQNELNFDDSVISVDYDVYSNKLVVNFNIEFKNGNNKLYLENEKNEINELNDYIIEDAKCIFNVNVNPGMYKVISFKSDVDGIEYTIDLKTKFAYEFTVPDFNEIEEDIVENKKDYIGYQAYPHSSTVYNSVHTLEQALDWLESATNNRRVFDFDGLGVSCTDLILEYTYAIGTKFPSLNATDYISSSQIPSSWSIISNGVPEKGDILVYNGHVAVYGGNDVTYHVNFAGAQYVRKITGYAYNGAAPGNTYLGCIHYNDFSTIVGSKTIEDGMYHIVSKQDTRFATNITGSSITVGSTLQLQSYNEEMNSQIFLIHHIENGDYSIQNYNSGLFLTSSSIRGATVYQDYYMGDDSQKWIIQSTNDGESFFIVSKKTGYLLDVYGANMSEGENINADQRNENVNQRWMFYETFNLEKQVLPNDIYYIVTKMDTNKGLSIQSGINIQLNDINSSSQQFKIESLHDGYYRIINVNSGLSLHVSSGGIQSGSNVELSTYLDGDMSYKWMVTKINDSYIIMNAKSGLVLDANGAKPVNGANIMIHTNNGGDNQRWIFKNVGPTEMNLDVTSLNLYVQDSYQFTTSFTPNNTSETIVWNSSDDSIVTVKDGKVTAHKKGKVTITASSTSGLVATCKVNVDNPTAHLEGYSLSLSGEIGVNFYMTFSQDVINDSKTSMKFTMNGSSTTQTLKDAKIVDINGTTCYVFNVMTSAKDMCSNIKAELINSKGTVKTYQYSVKDYANYIFNNYSSSSKEYQIAQKMMNYGHYVQKYFNYNLNSIPTIQGTISSNDLSKYRYQLKDSNENISFVGARLILGSKLGLKLYFIGNANFTCDSNYVQSKEGNYTVATIENINDVSKMYKISTPNFALQYSVLSYGQVGLNSANPELKNMINAMTDYYKLFVNI